MEKYPKIYSPYVRHVEGPQRNQLREGVWFKPEFEYLASLNWVWTEKIDGTNIRVHWDGHSVTFGGRTDNAQIPAPMVSRLMELFPEELFEQEFGAETVTLYGEGYGVKIQNGEGYMPDGVDFVLFDVRIARWWLERAAVSDIGIRLDLNVVPLVRVCSVGEAIDIVRDGLSSILADGRIPAEGLVGTPTLGLLDRSGERLSMKIKAKDFR